MSLPDLIKDRIHHQGALTIAEYMELALAHPEHGYYMRRDPLGAQGDFTTSPEISQIFGELCGLWLARQWQVMGTPKAVLVELGPGRGTLMNDILRATKIVQGFHDALSIQMIETSPALRQKQWGLLAKNHAHIEWHETLEALPDKPLLFIANEFFDALPIRQFAGNAERMVMLQNDRLAFSHPSEAVDRESCVAAQGITTQLASHIARHGGAGLVIDYGYETGYIDTLQAVKQHEYCNILSEPGEADLTAHVDFSALKTAAQNAGARAYGPMAQGAFLGRLGAIERATRLCEGTAPKQQEAIMEGLKRLVTPDQMGELFRVMAMTHHDHPAPEGFA